jgi:hypothetical protein
MRQSGEAGEAEWRGVRNLVFGRNLVLDDRLLLAVAYVPAPVQYNQQPMAYAQPVPTLTALALSLSLCLSLSLSLSI